MKSFSNGYHAHPGKRETRLPIGKPLLTSFLALLCLYLFMWPLYSSYLPFGDDPAILQGAQSSPLTWVTQGFSRYFYAFPEWDVPFTDFLRPGVNAILRFEIACFGSHYALYFLLFFAAQGALVTCVVFLCKHFKVSQYALLLAALCTAFHPAFIDSDLWTLANHFDVWCGLFTVLAAVNVFFRRFRLAIVPLFAAVFTKEAALFAPIAACLSCYLLTRKKGLSAFLLLPLVAWLLVRKTLFRLNSGGLYAMSGGGLQGMSLSVIKGFLQWPDGAPSENAFKLLLSDHRLWKHLIDIVFFSANIVLWVLLATTLFSIWKAYRSSAAQVEDLAALAVWLLGALSFGVLAGAHPRFGGCIYPLEILYFAVAARQLSSERARAAAWAALVLLTMVVVTRDLQVLLHAQRRPMRGTHELTRELQHVKAGGTLFVIDSPLSFSNPSSLAALAGVQRRIVLLNEFVGCEQSNQAASMQVTPQGDFTRLHLSVPPCARLIFPGAAPELMMSALKPTGAARGTWARYYFPDSTLAAPGLRNQKTINIDFGRTMDVLFQKRPEDVFLFYDWPSASYRCTAGPC